jgi:hypothetical protein
MLITFEFYKISSLQFKGQTFTFDHVFGLEVSQVDLYTETAAPMLKSFLEGYNCTIMAYGQTGSGKYVCTIHGMNIMYCTIMACRQNIYNGDFRLG